MRALPTPLAALLAALVLVTACSVGSEGPATPGSPAAAEAEQVRRIAQASAELQQLSGQLTAQVDESRRAVAEGRSTPEAEIDRLQALVQQIEEQNAAVQAQVRELEDRVHQAAGDPAWPPEAAEQ